MRRAFALAALLAILGSLAIINASERGDVVYTIEVEGTIDAGIANFITKTMDRAERENAQLIIKLDTPGGLLSATKDIVDRMLDAKITVVVWVTPRGRWAYSAGTYILLASNVAAMDNATTIGAAEPRPVDPKTREAMAEWIGEVAKFRGRPVEVAENFVRNNLTMGPEEALDAGVIELIADDEGDILSYLGVPAAEVKSIEMGVISRVLRVLSDPQVVMILFIAGMLGIIVEVTTPGVGVPGVAGGICLLLSLWGLGILEINYAAIALLVLGAILLAVEIFTPGFGVFGVGGIVALVFGLMMVDKEPWVEVVGNIAKGVLLGLLAIFVAFVVLISRTIRKPVKVGREAMIGEVGVAVTNIDPKGTVKVKGELWTASSKKRIRKGEEVVVKDIKGLELMVERRREG